MKKKLLTILTLVVFCLSFLTGCNLVETDSKKDLAQVVATVGDENYSDEITKRDLLLVYTSNYSQYASYDQSEVIQYFLKQLVNRRILVQEAVKAIIEEKGDELPAGTTLSSVLTEKDGSRVSDQIKPLLKKTGYSDENMIWRLYNTAYNTALEAEETQIKSIIDKAKLAEDEDYVAPSDDEKTKRPVREDEDEDNAPVERKEFKYRGEDGKLQLDKVEEAERQYVKDAYKSYVSTLTQQDIFDENKSADYYITEYFEMMLVEQLEQQLINEHTRILEEQLIRELGAIGETPDAEAVKDSDLFKDLEKRYKRLQASQGQQFEASIDTNISAIEGLSDTTYLLYNVAQGQYGFVKHILFKFSDAAALEVTKLNSSDWTAARKQERRNALASKIDVEDLREAGDDLTDEELEKWEQDKNTNKWSSVELFMSFFNTAFGGTEPLGDVKKNTYGDPIYKAFKAPNYIAKSDEATVTEKWTADLTGSSASEYKTGFALIKDKFIDYEYAYTEDTASLGSTTNMLLPADADPFLSDQKYVTEFSEASRNVINLGIGYYTTVVTDYGIHLIMCVDTIEPQSDPVTGFLFNEDLAVRVILGDVNLPDGKKLTDDEKASSIYKIFEVLKGEKVDKNYNEVMDKVVESYENDGRVVKNDKLVNEILKLVG